MKMTTREIEDFADDVRAEIIRAYEKNKDAFEMVIVAKITPTDWTVHIDVGKRVGIRKR